MKYTIFALFIFMIISCGNTQNNDEGDISCDSPSSKDGETPPSVPNCKDVK